MMPKTTRFISLFYRRIRCRPPVSGRLAFDEPLYNSTRDRAVKIFSAARAQFRASLLHAYIHQETLTFDY